jgi:hypothetical protein
MAHFKVGDHVAWSSEAGRVQGTIKKRITSKIKFKGYAAHASMEEPQYLIKSDKTDHMAMHKGSALKKLKKLQSDSVRVLLVFISQRKLRGAQLIAATARLSSHPGNR